MKKCTLLLICFTAILKSFGTTITVDNNTPSAGQYSSIQAAINAASPGDTIYLIGSLTNYGAVSLNKRLSIFGTGYNPQKQVNLVSSVSTINIDTIAGVSGASRSHIAGLNVTWVINDNYGAKHMLWERNSHAGYFNLFNGGGSSNWTIKNSVLTSTFYINQASNLIFQNNLCYQMIFYASSQSTVLIDHNIFLHNIGSNTNCLDNVSLATLTNNIFWGTSPLGTNSVNNTFNNNLTFQTANDNIPGASNTGSGNFVGTNPQFVNAPTPAPNLTYNWNLSNASVGNNAGTDGQDLGIFGGNAALTDLTGMPPIPQMIEMNIQNVIIPPAGTLNVDFRARKNN